MKFGMEVRNGEQSLKGVEVGFQPTTNVNFANVGQIWMKFGKVKNGEYSPNPKFNQNHP